MTHTIIKRLIILDDQKQYTSLKLVIWTQTTILAIFVLLLFFYNFIKRKSFDTRKEQNITLSFSSLDYTN